MREVELIEKFLWDFDFFDHLSIFKGLEMDVDRRENFIELN